MVYIFSSNREEQKIVERELENSEEENSKLTRMLSKMKSQVEVFETKLAAEKELTVQLKRVAMETEAATKVTTYLCIY